MFSGKHTIHAAGLAIGTGLFLLVGVYGNPSDPVPAIMLLSVTSLVYLTALWQMARLEGGLPLSAILLWAAAFRLIAFCAEPVFSDDIYRMRWEGMVAAAGENPYALRPASAEAKKFRDHTWPLVDGKEFKAVYGPLLQSVQSASFAAGGGSIWVMKLSACLAELAIVGLLLAWLRRRGEPDWRLAAWAWWPQAAVEFWGMGHHDAVMMALVLGAILAAEARRWTSAGILLGLAGATKYWPLLLAGALARLAWKDRKWATASAMAGCAAAFAISWWAWRTDVEENMRFLGGFVGGWRNNDILFGALLWVTGSMEWAKLAGLAIIGVSSAASAALARTLDQAAWIIVLAILLVSANVHPWYLSWLLPFAVPRWPAPVLLWAALSPLHYTVLAGWRATGAWNGLSPWRWSVYGAVAVCLAVWIFRKLEDSKTRAGVPH
jgi:alpha-1,6-mannosyltransferase